MVPGVLRYSEISGNWKEVAKGKLYSVTEHVAWLRVSTRLAFLKKYSYMFSSTNA